MSDNSNIPPAVTHSYYVATEKAADGAMVVKGWFDIASDSDPSNYPDLSTLTPLSAEDWCLQYNQRPERTLWQIKDGKLAPYTSPTPVIPLKDRASTALQQARKTVYNNYSIIGFPTPAAWVTYLRALMAIEDGTDTASVSLPIPPSDKSP